MRNFTSFLLATALILMSSDTFSQGCNGLIISEVVEGWSNNKAIEIYNASPNAIDATDYGLVRFQNGSTTPGNITYLTDVVIEPYDVYVLVIDKRDPDGVDFEAPVWDELQLQADTFVNPMYNDGLEVMYFNGNDALALLTDDGETLVDVFGKIADSVNPDGWGGYIDSEGEQAYVSANHTLIRKPDVIEGYSSNPDNFNILNEYDSLPANTFTELGFHICECDADNVEEYDLSDVRLFPNPSVDGMTFLAALQGISKVEIYNATGVKVEEIEIQNLKNVNLNLSELVKGMYFLNITLESGEEISEKLMR